MHKKRTILVAAVAALTLSSTAYASGNIPYVFGHGGTGVPLSASCQRAPVNIPLGTTWMHAKPGVERIWTIQSAELKCLTKRVIKLARRKPTVTPPVSDSCWAEAGPVPVVKQIHKDDWTNVGQLAAWTSALAACESSRNAS